VQGVLSCFDLRSGHLYWQRKLGEEFDLDPGFFGFATSPLIEGDMLILNLGQDKSVAGFDRMTGVLQWLSNDPWGRSYATPVAATLHGQRVVLVFAGGNTNPPVGGLLCLDPRSGHQSRTALCHSKSSGQTNTSPPSLLRPEAGGC